MFYTVLSFTYRSWWGGDVGDDDEGHDQVGDDVGDADVGQHSGGDGRRSGGGRQARMYLKKLVHFCQIKLSSFYCSN